MVTTAVGLIEVGALFSAAYFVIDAFYPGGTPAYGNI